MTPLTKAVTRKTSATFRDAGRVREISVTIFPNNTIGFRLHKTRRMEIITIESGYSLGVKQRVAAEQAKKRNQRMDARKAKYAKNKR